MDTKPVLEIVHLRLHPSSSVSYPLERLVTADLPAAFIETWKKIVSSATKAGGHCFRLYRSVTEPADFYFIGGWDDAGIHARTIARAKDTQLAASLGKWMEHIRIRHIKADVNVLDGLDETAEARVVIRNMKGSSEDLYPASERQNETGGWDVSEEVCIRHPEFKTMAASLNNPSMLAGTDGQDTGDCSGSWVFLKFGPESDLTGPDSLLLSIVVGAPGRQNEEDSSQQ